jgi:histidinol dehydrogenase
VRVEWLVEHDVRRLGGPRGTAVYIRSLVVDDPMLSEDVEAILAAVRVEGDEAVRRLTREFDTAGADPRPLVVPAEELDEAIAQLPLDVVAGLQVAIANVAQVAQTGVTPDASVALSQGHRITLREVPVEAAAVYVPGGRAPYPSTAVMGVVTARAAGVVDVAVCSPPRRDGQIDPVILGACRLLGVERVYRMGGAQAIGALAFGTKTVESVDVIVGPGNLYVQEAKRQLSQVVGIDGFAGPSDLMVVFDGETLRDCQLVALDMLAQAEHGRGSLVVAVSSSRDALSTVHGELLRHAEWRGLEGAECVLVRCADTHEGVELANAFAPEHLQLIGAEAEALAPAVRTAGCLFVGAAAATAFGDYVAGSNHILPTAGAARFASGLSPRHFRRRMAEVRLGEVGGEAVGKLAAAGAPIAHAEGFVLHARSMEARGVLPTTGSSTAGTPPEPPVREN